MRSCVRKYTVNIPSDDIKKRPFLLGFPKRQTFLGVIWLDEDRHESGHFMRKMCYKYEFCTFHEFWVAFSVDFKISPINTGKDFCQYFCRKILKPILCFLYAWNLVHLTEKKILLKHFFCHLDAFVARESPGIPDGSDDLAPDYPDTDSHSILNCSIMNEV